MQEMIFITWTLNLDLKSELLQACYEGTSVRSQPFVAFYSTESKLLVIHNIETHDRYFEQHYDSF